ncbi:hypothetical protein [Latilactobacillus fuchuensis]|nr:hypothetical protein [Latilactobacillus fuchuensis]
MTRQQLAAIMKQRYFKYLIGLLLLMVGIQAAVGLQQGQSWQRDNQYYHSTKFVKDYKADSAKYAGYQDGSGKQPAKVTLESFQEEVLNFFDNRENAVPSVMTLTIAFICMTAGLLTFTYDRRTNFDAFLFGLATNRRSIYWAKIKLVGLMVLAGIVIGQSSYYLILKTMVHQPYFNIEIGNLLQHELALLIILMGLYVLGCFLGLVVGELVTLLVGAYGLLFTLTFNITNLEDLRHFIQSRTTTQYGMDPGSIRFFLNRILDTHYVGTVYRNRKYFVLIIGILMTSMFVLWLGQRIYQKSSLEHQNKVVTMDWLKWPLLILGTLYVAFLMTMNGVFSRLPYDLLDTHEKYLLLWYFIRNVVLVGIIGWLFIDRPWQRKIRLSGLKINRKIN